MGRSRSRQGSVLDDLFAFLLTMPTWVGPLVAVGAYAGTRWFLPWAFSPSDPDNGSAKVISSVMNGVGPNLLCWLPALLSWCGSGPSPQMGPQVVQPPAF